MARLERQLTKLLEMETKGLAGYLAGKLEKAYGEKLRYATESYIFAEGNIPVMLVAHMDTVFSQPPKVQLLTTGILTSNTGLGADDRAGIFAILKLLDDGYKPYVLFTNEEEIGCIGASEFVDRITTDDVTIPVNFIIELDRKGKNDAVYYDCVNAEFEKFIESYGFKYSVGSFTDICVVAPAVGVAAVNLSVGYYYQHTRQEILILSELMDTIRKVAKILDGDVTTRYEYESAYVDHVNTWNFSGSTTEKDDTIEVLTPDFDDETIEMQIEKYNAGNPGYTPEWYDKVDWLELDTFDW